MAYELRAFERRDVASALAIFNHYVAAGTAAYPESPLSPEALGKLGASEPRYPVVAGLDAAGAVVGFAMLRPWHALPTFLRTAEVSYFIAPEHVGQGLGSIMLAGLCDHARTMGVATLLASISAENVASLEFHARRGFVECGRFRQVGLKHGRTFDVIWMQRVLAA